MGCNMTVCFCYQQFFILIFSHITQHNIQNKTADTYSTSQGPIKREGEREVNMTVLKELSYSYVLDKQKHKRLFEKYPKCFMLYIEFMNLIS